MRRDIGLLESAIAYVAGVSDNRHLDGAGLDDEIFVFIAYELGSVRDRYRGRAGTSRAKLAQSLHSKVIGIDDRRCGIAEVRRIVDAIGDAIQNRQGLEIHR